MFHVEPSYHAIWKDCRYVLKQRNALLRQNASRSSFAPWDNQLVFLSEQLHSLRDAYFIKLICSFNKFVECLTNVSCSISYFKGWDRRETGNDLLMILHDQFSSDQQRRFTTNGAHQADIFFEIPAKKAKSFYSRGQQKIILIALKLAQASLLPSCCLYLFDDLAAELDEAHIDSLMTCLSDIPGQKFITSVDGKLASAINLGRDVSSFNVLGGMVC
jgi:DNA replication and repair protein RecF